MNVENGRSYVGITTRTDPFARWGEHIRKARTKSGQVLQRAIASYGDASFRFEVIASAISDNSLAELERILIAQHRTLTRQGGYNCRPGGEMGFPPDDDARMRISEKAKCRWQDPDYRSRSTAAIAASRTQEFKEKAAIKQAAVWRDPKYRAARTNEDSAVTAARVRADWTDPVKRAARIEAIRIGKRKGGAEQRAKLSAAVRAGKQRARQRYAVSQGQLSLLF